MPWLTVCEKTDTVLGATTKVSCSTTKTVRRRENGGTLRRGDLCALKVATTTNWCGTPIQGGTPLLGTRRALVAGCSAETLLGGDWFSVRGKLHGAGGGLALTR